MVGQERAKNGAMVVCARIGGEGCCEWPSGLAPYALSRRGIDHADPRLYDHASEGGTLLMAITFDATLKDMGRDSPGGFVAAFDRPPTGPVTLLNVDLSTVTTAAD